MLMLLLAGLVQIQKYCFVQFPDSWSLNKSSPTMDDYNEYYKLKADEEVPCALREALDVS